MARFLISKMLMCLVIMKFGYINNLPSRDFYKPGTSVESKSTIESTSEKEAELTTLSTQQNEIIVFEAKKETYPFEVYLSKIRDPSIRYARDSVNEKIGTSKRDQKTIFFPNFFGMIFAISRLKYQERILQEKKKIMDLDEFDSKSLGNNVQFWAQVLYGYGYWGRYTGITDYLKFGKVTCNYEGVDLVIAEYVNIFKDCDKLDSNMADLFAKELNRKIRKNLHCLLAHSHGSEQVNDLMSNIDIFTSLLSENCGA